MNILEVVQDMPTWAVWVMVVSVSLYSSLLVWRLVGRLSRAVVGKGLLKLWFGQVGEK